MLKFEWDPEKNRANKRKHRIGFEVAATVFSDPLAITIFDHDHSDDEDRFATIGSVRNNVVVVVCHTDRIGVIRIISARKANKTEKAQYHEG